MAKKKDETEQNVADIETLKKKLAEVVSPPPRPEVTRTVRITGSDFKFNMGDEVRDIVTGLEGVIVGREDCITGCSRMSVQPKVTDGRTMPTGYFIDQDRLVLLEEVKTLPFEVAKAGGPITPAPMDRAR